MMVGCLKLLLPKLAVPLIKLEIIMDAGVVEVSAISGIHFFTTVIFLNAVKITAFFILLVFYAC